MAISWYSGAFWEINPAFPCQPSFCYSPKVKNIGNIATKLKQWHPKEYRGRLTAREDVRLSGTEVFVPKGILSAIKEMFET